MAYERPGCKSQMPTCGLALQAAPHPLGAAVARPGDGCRVAGGSCAGSCSAGSAAMTGAHEAAFNAEKPALLAAEFFRTPLRKEIIPRSELGQRLVHAGLRFVA